MQKVTKEKLVFDPGGMSGLPRHGVGSKQGIWVLLVAFEPQTMQKI